MGSSSPLPSPTGGTHDKAHTPDTPFARTHVPQPSPSLYTHYLSTYDKRHMNHLPSDHLQEATLSDQPPPTRSAFSFPSPVSPSPSPTNFSSSSTNRGSRHSSQPAPSPIWLPTPDQRFSRRFTLDSPTLYEYPPLSYPHTIQSLNAKVASLDTAATESPNNLKDKPAPSPTDFDVLLEYDDLISESASASVPDQTPATIIDDQTDDSASDCQSIYSDNNDKSLRSNSKDNLHPPVPMFSQKHTPPHLHLQPIAPATRYAEPRLDTPQSPSLSSTPRLHKPLPKSPGQASPLATFFGWGSPSPSATEFSSASSPLSPRPGAASDAAYTTAKRSQTEGTRPNATDNPIEYVESYLSTPPLSESSTSIEDMEDELKAITAELAASIRREMDLEDLVDRLQEQASNAQGPSKRSSDYFSDSGYSSAKQSDYDQSREEVEKVQRRAEQEKASIRVELTSKLQDERSKRKALDQQIRDLAERASHVDLAQMNQLDAGDRVKDLEATCEDLRRRLSEERQSKANFEDLLSALKTELSDVCNERDNLRDEVLPRLRARVEGLEIEAAEYANLTYESSKMQQELQALKSENQSLRNNAGPGSEEVVNRGSRASSFALSRSNSVATLAGRNQKPPPLSLKRSSSVKGSQPESRDALVERLKDVEAQRDALHKALKNLLDRQEFQTRESTKKIRALEEERQRLLTSSPKKAGFEKEVANLRTEINVLRRRAEDVLEQKWQVEKGLGGLKMDLDRAEEEIAALRALLAEHDILIPPSVARSSGSSGGFDNTPVTSESLRQAYKELQDAYQESLERIKKLETDQDGPLSNDAAKVAMERLEKSLSIAISERDAANQEAQVLRSNHESLAARESKNLEAERVLADELSESAEQIEQLASQVRQQLAANADLRQRLADTVARGDADRKANSDRIATLQDRLRVLEEQVITAQTVSEERIARHEEEVASLREAHNERLQRTGSSPGLGGLRSPGFKSPLKSPRKSPLLSPMNSPMFPRSPRFSQSKSFEEESEMIILRARVLELEKALSDTETEMQEVVARMAAAQIEVLNLQEEREAAVRETRRLQKVLEQEQVKAFEERFKTLQANA